MIIGYTTGVYDLFHVGHLRLLKRAKALCDRLIVAVTTDELMIDTKGHSPVIPFAERFEIVKNIKCVDVVLVQRDMDKLSMWKKLNFDVLLVGDDWFGTAKWRQYEKEFKPFGVSIIYLPYTKGISSTLINKSLGKIKNR